MRSRCRRILTTLAFVALSPVVAVGQPAKVGIVTTLEGNVTARRAALPRPVALKFKDDVFFHDTITTGEHSLARVLLGGKSIVTVRERSAVTISEAPGRSFIDLQSGKVGVAVAHERMVGGESLDIRTPTAVVGIRGTVVVAEVTCASAGACQAPDTTNFYMLRGRGEVQQLDPASGSPIGPPRVLAAGFQFTVTGGVARLVPIPPGHENRVTAGLHSTGHPHHDAANHDQVKNQVVDATMAVLTALTGGLPGRPAAPTIPGGTSPGTSPSTVQIAQALLVPYEGCDEGSSGGCQGPGGTVSPPSGGAAPIVTQAGSIVSNAFPERQILNDVVNLTNVDRIFVSGGSYVRGDPSAAVQIVNSTMSYTGAQAFVQVDGSTTTANLAGGLASVVDSAINASGGLFTLANGAQLASATATRSEGGLVEINGPAIGEIRIAGLAVAGSSPLIEIDRSTVISESGIASVLNGARLALGGPFVAITDAVLETTSDQFSMLSVLNGASLIATNPDLPVFGFVGSGLEQRSRVTSAGNFLALGGKTAPGTSPASMTLAGGLLAASRVDFTAGDPTKNVFSFIFAGDGAKLTSTSPNALLAFQDSSVETAGNILTLRRSRPDAPSQIDLGGPLLAGASSRFQTTSQGFGPAFGTPGACCSGFAIEEGARLTSTTPSALIQLIDSTFDAGPDPRLSGGDLVTVADFSGDPAAAAAAAQVALSGPLVSMTNSTVRALSSILHVERSSFSSSGPDPLIQVQGQGIAVGGLDPISKTNVLGSVLDIIASTNPGTAEAAATVSIAGSLLSASNANITSTDVIVRVRNGARFESSSVDPLIALRDTSVSLGTGAVANTGHVLNVFGTGGPNGTTRATAVLNGALLVAEGSSQVNALSGLVFASDGQILASAADSFVRLVGGTHALASAANTSMFSLIGGTDAPVAVEIVDGVPLSLGTFAPLVWKGGDHSLLRLEAGAAVSGQEAFRIDRALFQATAPVFELLAASSLTVAPTTAVDGGLMNLNAQAKVVSLGPVARLDASTIIVANNNAFRVAGGSLLQVIGDFLSLSNGSVLQALNGSVMRVSGGSVVNISGAFAIFGGSGGNQIRVSNTLCGSTCAGTTFGGIPIALINGATPAQVTVTGSALKGTNLGSIVQLGPVPAAAAVIVVDGPASRLTIRGQ